MANTLMFEVGVQDAKGQLSKLEERLKGLVTKYGTMQLKVEVQNLEKFLQALSKIGNGDVLEPLIRRVDLLQTTIANMGTQGATSLREFEVAVKTNTAVADQYRKRIEELTNARDKYKFGTDAYARSEKRLREFQDDKRTLAIFAQEKTAIDNLANAQAHLSNEEKKGGASANEFGNQINKLSETIDSLSKKTFSVNMGNEFKTWAEQVQALVAQVKELISQMEKLNKVQNQVSTQQQIPVSNEGTKKTVQEIEALKKELKELSEGPLKQYLEALEKSKAVIENWRVRPEALGIGDAKKQMHDLLDIAQMLNRLAEKNGSYLKETARGGLTGNYLKQEDAISAIAKSYKVTNEEAERLLRTLVESELVGKRFKATLEGGKLKLFDRETSPYLGPVSHSSDAHYRQSYYLEKENAEYVKVGEQARRYAQIQGELNGQKEKSEQATQKLVQSEQKLAQVQQQSTQHGNLFDQQKFVTLQEAIDKIIAEINRLKEAFAGIGHIEGLTTLTTEVNGLMHNVNSLKDVLSTLSGAVKLDASSDILKKLQQDATAAEKKIQELQEKIDALQDRAKRKKGETALTDEEKVKKAADEAAAAKEKEEQAERKLQIAEENRMKLLAQLEEQIRKIANISEKAGSLNINQAEIGSALSAFNNFFQSISNDKFDPKMFNATFGRLKEEYRAVVAEADKFNKAVEKSNEQLAKEQSQNYARNMKAIQNEIDLTIRKLRDLDDAIARGARAGRDMSELTDARSKLQGQLMLLQGLTPKDKSDSAYVEKRIKDIQQLREDTERLRQSQEKLTAAQEQQKKRDDRMALKNLADEIKSVDDATIKYNHLAEKIADLQALRARGVAANIDLSAIDTAIAKYEQLQQVLQRIINNDGRTAFGQLTKNLLGDPNIDKLLLEATRGEKVFKESLKDVESRMNSAARTADNLSSHLDNIAAKRTDFKGLDTSRLDAAIQKIRDIRNELDFFSKTGMSAFGSSSKDIIHNMGLAQANKEVKDAMAELTSQKNTAAQATAHLSSEESKLSSALASTTNEMKNQSQVLSDLKMMAMQYISVWGAQSFVHNIIETGGLLEQQRLSLSAILGDMDKATDLFEQVKALAVKSPFGVVQIDQMTKQLAAYGFEYKELFDWTKRLADISAATGTEVSRLSLALGHVRAEGALSGYTLRQFAMANVPLLRMLSENRGVSTKEIRDLVRKKEISDKEVQNVLLELTNEGGMFYNAQEVMSQALNAKFKNLRDSFDIMYNEIAESFVGNALKGVAVVLTDISKQWKRFGMDVIGIGVAFGVARAAIALYNATLTKGTANTLKSALAKKRQDAALLRLAQSYRTLTLAEQRTIATSGKLTAAELANLLSTKKLSTEELLRAVALGKLSRAEAIAAVESMKLDAAQKKLLLSQLQGMQHTRRWTMLLTGFGNAAGSAGRAILGFAKVLLPMAALGGVIDLFSRNSQQKEKAEDAGEAGATKTLSTLKQVNEIYNELTNKRPEGISATEDAIERMTEALKDSGRYTEEFMEKVEKTDELTAKYNLLYKKIQDVSDAYLRAAESVKVFMQEAYKTGGGLLSDNMQTDLKDWAEADVEMIAAKMNLDRMGASMRKTMEDFLKSKNLWDEGKMGGMGWNELYNKTLDDKLRQRLWSWMKENEKGDLTKAYGRYIDAIDDWYDKEAEIAKQLPEFTDKVNAAFEEQYKDMGWKVSEKDNWTDKQKRLYAEFVDEMIAANNDLNENIKETFKDRVIKITLGFVPTLYRGSLDEGIDKQLDFMRSNPMLYNFYMDDMLDAMNSRKSGGMIGIDRVQTLFGDFNARNAKDAAEKIAKQYKENKESLETLKKLPQTSDVTKQIGSLTQDITDTELWAKYFGFNLEELASSKNKKSGSGSHKDELLETWKKRTQLLEKYRSQREKLMKLLTEEQAESKLREDGNFDALWEYFENPNDYKGSIDQLIKFFEAIATTDSRKSFVEELGGKKGEEELRNFTDRISDAVKELSRLMSVMSENYDTYKKWLELTGDEGLAASIAGVSRNSSYADWLKEQFIKNGGTGSADKFFGLGETDARAYGENSALFKLWEEWQKNEKKLRQEQLTRYEEAIKNAKGYSEKVADINRELQREKEAIEKLGDADGKLAANAEKNAKEKIAKLTWENFKETENWGRVFSDLDKVSSQSLREMLERLKEIAPTVRDDAESMKAIYDAMKKAEDILGTRNPFAALTQSTGKMSALRGLLYQGGATGYGFRNATGNYTIGAEEARKLGLEVNASGQYTEDEIREALYRASKEFEDAINKVVEKLNQFKGAMDLLAETFDALGMTGASQAIGDASGLLGGVLGGASSMSAFGPWGMAAGAALGLIGGIAKQHDANLQRQIEKMQDEVDALEANTEAINRFRERTLGYDTGRLRSGMSNLYNDTSKRSEFWSAMSGGQDIYVQSAAKQAMKEYYSMNSVGSGYTQELKNLEDERQKYIDMYDTENAKKKASQDSLDEYRDKIAELDEQIMYFTEDLENELWGIDIKGWADQISDAIMTAFENGEDAVKAFDETVEDIMRDVAQNMLKVGVIEPMLERMRARLTGQGEYENPFDLNDPNGSAQRIFQIISEEFGMLKQQVPIMEQALEQLQAMSEYDMKGGTGSSSGSSIKGVTENTADLLASYINAIRADVSVNRAMLSQYFPMYYAAMTSGNASLASISNHTAAIMQSNQSILDQLVGLRNKTWKVPMA